MELNQAGEEVVCYAPDGTGLSLQDIFWDMKPQPRIRRKPYEERTEPRKKSRRFDPPTDMIW